MKSCPWLGTGSGVWVPKPFFWASGMTHPFLASNADKDSIMRFLSRPPVSDESVVAAFKRILAACNEAWGR